jgi:hypothetical protein
MAAATIRIDRPFHEVAGLLSARPADWIVPFVRIAAHVGEASAGRSLQLPSPPGSRQIAVELLQPVSVEGEAEMVVPLRWRTAGFRWVPPSYAGRIIVRRKSSRCCEILLEGSYALPDDALDQKDAAAAFLATKATIATFLRAFRSAVEEQARETV